MDQVLILDPPSELHFKPPCTGSSTFTNINLTNPSDRDVCFKVKTTALESCFARPNGGTIHPEETVSVTVKLVASGISSRDRLLIQSAFAPDGEYSFDAFWKDTPADHFMNSIIKYIPDKGRYQRCVNCRHLKKLHARSRIQDGVLCNPCYQYERRKGEPRPARLYNRQLPKRKKGENEEEII